MTSSDLFALFLMLGSGFSASILPNDWRDRLDPIVFNKTFQNPVGSTNRDIKGVALRKTGVLHNALTDRNQQWKSGVVAYKISGAFDVEQQQAILTAMSQIESGTCIRFVERTNQEDFIFFASRQTGCWSFVGRIGRNQTLNLDPRGCIYNGIIIHEILHALGFHHEQNRSDRDEHIDIYYDNILRGAISQFEKQKTDDLGIPYDYDSIMHYQYNAFAIDEKQPTILPKKGEGHQLGQRKGLSPSDVQKINRFYECGTKNYEEKGEEYIRPAGCFSWWTVESGKDTCDSVASACGISLEELYHYNPRLRDEDPCSRFTYGQQLCCQGEAQVSGSSKLNSFLVFTTILYAVSSLAISKLT